MKTHPLNSPSQKGWQTKSDGVVPSPKGSKTKSDGVVPSPKGSKTKSDGVVPSPKGSKTKSNGVVPSPKGSKTKSNGVVPSPKGSKTKPNGVVPSPKGSKTKPNGVVPSPKGSQTKSNRVVKWHQIPFNPKLKERARALRKARNLPEVLFWKQVRNKQFLKLDFDRQKIVGNYIVDFYCKNIGVVVEIDGSSHIGKEEYDKKRDAYLESIGLTVIHIQVVDIIRNMGEALDYLKDKLALHLTSQDILLKVRNE